MNASNKKKNVASSSRQEALNVVIDELERSLVTLEASYQRAVSNLNVLRERVEKDDLTRLLRRDEFMNRLQTLLVQSREEGRDVQVLMIDVDHFKHVNDTYGHQTGDVVLQRISELVCKYLQPGGLAGRYGGEEIILAVQSGGTEALAIAESIRKAVENSCMVARKSGRQFAVTLSAGIASTREFEFEADTLIDRADAALYRAKHSGRNRVITAQQERVAAA
jgi:diguanylate cyclase (GGDEF)-like protein